jgi:hypothetical protein
MGGATCRLDLRLLGLAEARNGVDSRTAPTSANGESEGGEEGVSFGVYTRWPRARILQDRLGPVQLGGRALDLHIERVRQAGEAVSKEDLMRAVWQDVSWEKGTFAFISPLCVRLSAAEKVTRVSSST